MAGMTQAFRAFINVWQEWSVEPEISAARRRPWARALPPQRSWEGKWRGDRTESGRRARTCFQGRAGKVTRLLRVLWTANAHRQRDIGPRRA